MCQPHNMTVAEINARRRIFKKNAFIAFKLWLILPHVCTWIHCNLVMSTSFNLKCVPSSLEIVELRIRKKGILVSANAWY